MESHDDNLNSLMKLKFGPRWGDRNVIRKFIVHFLSGKVTNKEDADKISMASSELFENAYKYSKAGGAIIEIMIYTKTEPQIMLSIANITSTLQIEKFKAIYDLVHSKKDPEEAYTFMIKKSHNKPQSQLGLARLRCECGARILYTVSDNISEIHPYPLIESDLKMFKINLVFNYPVLNFQEE